MDKSLYTLDFMRHTYENFPIGVFVYGDDEQGEIVYTNPLSLILKSTITIYNPQIRFTEPYESEAEPFSSYI